ncbi:MAG: FAD:protein FMN transferase [Verrucomicrobiota bacterium]
MSSIQKFAHHAMATKFEMFVASDSNDNAKHVAVELWNEIDRLENELSRFREGSDIWRLNRSQTNTWVRFGLDAFECLKQALDISAATNGAFDPTIGPLFRYWRECQDNQVKVDPKVLSEAKKAVGWQKIILDEDSISVKMLADHMQLDLGGVGKGYALDTVAELLLDDWEMNEVMLSAGGSTVLVLDQPVDEVWDVGLGGLDWKEPLLLNHSAVSGSGMGVQGEHIINPRTGNPVPKQNRVWALAKTAATSDALSTAFMVMNQEEINTYLLENPETQIFC